MKVSRIPLFSSSLLHNVKLPLITSSTQQQHAIFSQGTFAARNSIPKSQTCCYMSNNVRHSNDSFITQKEIYNRLIKHNKDTCVLPILSASVDLLEEYNAPEPTLSACHLLSQALQDVFPRWEDNGFAALANILQDPRYDKNLCEAKVTDKELHVYAGMLERRIHKEPLQYIIGQWDFYNCVLKIRPPCLCPRPETEELVEYVAQDIRQMIEILRQSELSHFNDKVRILDVGCGTGAIGIALAKMFPNDVIVSSMDVSEDAVALSTENAKFVLSDNQSHYQDPLLCSAKEYTHAHAAENMFQNCTFEYDVVVSNPPYIPSKDMATLTADVRDFEDYGALCGGLDGLDVVRDIIQRLPEWCKPRNTMGRRRPFHAVCWMEVDTTHPRLIEKYVANDECVEYVHGLQDLSGLDRFVKLVVKH
jgi:release factor glutamine methyltransferase